MASWSFFEGKTVDAALKNAGKELGVPKEKLEYEIVFSGASGIFGLVGAKNAKIRVATPTPPSGSKASPNSVADKERQEIMSLVDETFAETSSSQVSSASSSRTSVTSGSQASVASNRQASVEEPVLCETDEAADAAPAPAPEKTYTEADFEMGKNALSRMVESIVAGATISVQIKNQQVLFNIEGDNAAMLIGKHGQTLKAMQHIVEKIVHKSCGERIRVLVDIEEYMEKRRATLKSLATRLADKVRQTGKPTTINRMDAFERKIIHDALRKNKDVKTRSAGGGEVRNVVIHPGKKGGRTKKAIEK